MFEWQCFIESLWIEAGLEIVNIRHIQTDSRSFNHYRIFNGLTF